MYSTLLSASFSSFHILPGSVLGWGAAGPAQLPWFDTSIVLLGCGRDAADTKALPLLHVRVVLCCMCTFWCSLAFGH